MAQSKYLLPDGTTNADVDQRTNTNSDVVKAPFVVPRLADGTIIDATHGLPAAQVDFGTHTAAALTDATDVTTGATLLALIKGLIKIFADLWDTTHHAMNVNIVADTTTGPGGTSDSDALFTRQARGTLTTGQVSVATTATLIKATATGRLGISLVNTGAATVFIGTSSSVTTSNGHAVPAGASFSVDQYAGDLYGIVASGTVAVSYAAVA